MATAHAVAVPNQFNLYGRGCLMIGLMTNGIDGKPSLTYHDESIAHEFHGDEVVHDSTQLGDLYTVTLWSKEKVGQLTFTVVIPPVNLVGLHHLETIGIRTIHRTADGITPGGALLGQAEAYRTCRLWGTATQVEPVATAKESATASA
jgi:hypothetical protein